MHERLGWARRCSSLPEGFDHCANGRNVRTDGVVHHFIDEENPGTLLVGLRGR